MAKNNFPDCLKLKYPGDRVGPAARSTTWKDIQQRSKGRCSASFGWLSEKDRRRDAAVEAAKLGHGGVEYIARVLACDPKTIRRGLHDLEEVEDAAAGRIRKQGGDARSA